MYEQGKEPPFAESHPLVIQEIDLDGPGPGEVLVRIVAAGLCHSDLSAITGQRRRVVPVVVGHEAAGVVEDLGPGVDDFAVGDHVVMVFAASCGRCVFCDNGRPNLCQSSWSARTNGTLQTGARRLSVLGKALNHYSGISAFAEYAVVVPSSLVRIDPEVPLKDAAIFGCAVVTGVGSVINTARVPAGAVVAIVGLGGVGLSALLGAVAIGAVRIVAIDTNPAKLELARSLGATETANASDAECASSVLEATGGGVHFAFEAVGSTAAAELAYAITARGGTSIIIGLADASQRLVVPLTSLAEDERVIRGSYMGSCVPRRDIPRYVALYREGKLPVDRLRSGEVSFSSINAGFDRLARGETVRDLLVP